MEIQRRKLQQSLKFSSTVPVVHKDNVEFDGLLDSFWSDEMDASTPQLSARTTLGRMSPVRARSIRFDATLHFWKHVKKEMIAGLRPVLRPSPAARIRLAPVPIHKVAAFHVSARTLAKKQKDPYDLLGVTKSSSASDIKKAYYAKAKEYHPDTNKDPSAKDKFQELQQAYD
ncbi:DnaJ domain-containing protein, partial [Chytriomyces sp. MP71]